MNDAVLVYYLFFFNQFISFVKYLTKLFEKLKFSKLIIRNFLTFHRHNYTSNLLIIFFTISSTSASVGFWPSDLTTLPNSSLGIWPAPSLSNSMKHSLMSWEDRCLFGMEMRVLSFCFNSYTCFQFELFLF